MEQLQHPSITHCERTGYPPSVFKHEPVKCSVCDGEIATGEHYGSSEANPIICIDCVDEEFKSFTAKEKLEVLGYEVKWNG